MTKKELLENKVFQMIPDDAVITVRLGSNVAAPVPNDGFNYINDGKGHSLIVLSVPTEIKQWFNIEQKKL